MFTTLENRSSDRKIKKKKNYALPQDHKYNKFNKCLYTWYMCKKSLLLFFFSVKRPRSTNFYLYKHVLPYQKTKTTLF